MDFLQTYSSLNHNNSNNSNTVVTSPEIPGFTVTLREYQQFKIIFGDCLYRLESLILRFKTVLATNEMSGTSRPNSVDSNKQQKRSSSMITNNVDDLRTVLADIDHHLILLKDMEDRNSKICESFSKEIRIRDDALVEKMSQINTMSHEMAQLQSRINQLMFKNSQLETEMKYLKTVSSLTNTETSSTPVKMIPSESESIPAEPAVLVESKLRATGGWTDLELPQVSSPPEIENHEEGFVTPTNKTPVSTKVSVYHDLLVQYKKIEQLIEKTSTAMTQQQQEQDQNDPESGPADAEATVENIPLSEPETVPLLAEKTAASHGDGGEKLTEPTPSSDTEVLDNEDVVATSIKAYEHFVKMQHDLEVLMKKENEYRAKIFELERENQRLEHESKENEFQLSNVQYELDILKHNYELEIESFSTAINEREGLIEKLQQKMQSLKARYEKLDERRRSANEQLLVLQARIEELEGRLKYEELQKQTLIDARVSELEARLEEQEREYQTELNNLKTDLACKTSVERELRAKIEELELSLKNIASPEFEDEFVYYKNQIDSLVKELDKERQERQRVEERFEQEIRAKDRLVEQTREQAKKEKEAMMREKTDYEQRYRKMVSKLKSKEMEMKQLQEKLMLVTGTGEDNKQNSPRAEQLVAESALKDLKLNELSSKIEEYEERSKELAEHLREERERRRRLETYYLNAIRNHELFVRNGNDQHIYHQQQQSSLSNIGNHRRDSAMFLSVTDPDSPSLALLMDPPCWPDDNDDGQLLNNTHRWLRRQKNILLFGRPKAKIIRLGLLVYLILLHYLAFFRQTESVENFDDNQEPNLIRTSETTSQEESSMLFY